MYVCARRPCRTDLVLSRCHWQINSNDETLNDPVYSDRKTLIILGLYLSLYFSIPHNHVMLDEQVYDI